MLTDSSKDYYEDHIDFKRKNVEIEIRMVSYSDAVVQPLAVMVKPLHTPIADIAMP